MAYIARFYGRVQGVFFRATARSLAHRLSARGWVRNLPDGSVELVTDRKELVDAMAEKKDPQGIFVERVEIKEEEVDLPDGFEIRF